MATAEEFYDSFSPQYTEAIKKCVPRYEEMLGLLLRYIPSAFAPGRILELGCGTGDLTAMIAHKYPDPTLVAVDFSGETLAECKRRLNNPRITFVQEHFEKLSFAKGSLDLVVSSISIHHLSEENKNRLFHNVFEWLTDNGIFTFADQFRGETDEVYERHIDLWKAHATERAVSNEEWEMWMEHQCSHDHHATIREHLSWLEKCEFVVADCVWRYSLWAKLYARK